MPKLKKVQFYCRTKRAPGITFEVQVSVSQDGMFYCSSAEIPARIRELQAPPLDDSTILQSNTLAGLRGSVEELISHFEQILMDQGKEKVILYRILLQGDLTPDLGGSEEGSRRHRDLDRECELGLGLDWCVVWKHRILSRVEYKPLRGSRRIEEYKRKEMVWSPEREAWFQGLEESIRSLLLRVDGFFSERDPLQLAEFIDSGGSLLPAPESLKNRDQEE